MFDTTPDASADDILYALQYADTEGTDPDDWSYPDINDDRAKRLEAAATLIALKNDNPTGLRQVEDAYRGGDAVYELTTHLIEFDRRHGTSRGAIPAGDAHWDGPDYQDYVAQEWAAAHATSAAA